MPEIIHQGAIIPYRVNDTGQLEIALITSRSGKKWIVPKGIIDPGEDAPTAAARECEEEAGLIGELHDDAIGQYDYEKWGCICRVQVFAMQVTQVFVQWDEDDFRERKWFRREQAIEKLADKELQSLVRQLHELLK